MPQLELCDECTGRLPEEFAATCGSCGAILCPACDEDDNHACAQAADLPLAA